MTITKPDIEAITQGGPAMPITGDVVLYHMPDAWQPSLGIRIYPALVLYPNRNYGPGGLDLQVFAAPYDPPGGYHVSARFGTGPGTWQDKRPGVNQQPLRGAAPRAQS